MKKEEFPTFLNEQPTIIFGRTGRELLILGIGATLAYMTWIRLGLIIPGGGLGMMVLKALVTAIPIVISAVVALMNIAGRPLEEWAFAGLFYFLIPKVYVYTPLNVAELAEDEDENEDAFFVEDLDQFGNQLENEY
jgi:hypothetical protein